MCSYIVSYGSDMSRLWGRMLPLTVMLLFLLWLLVSCSKQDGPGEKGNRASTESNYNGWLTYHTEKVRITYPPGLPAEPYIDDAAEWYGKRISDIGALLRVPPPADTLQVYYYTGYGHGLAATGREYPYATPEAIHFWLPGTYGPTLTEFLLQNWKVEGPKSRFLLEGFKTLLDYSGQNYYLVAKHYIDLDSALSLRALSMDRFINSDSERYQSVFAAMFVDYIMYAYGVDGIHRLYVSPLPFPEALLELTGMSMEEIEPVWYQFIRESFPGEKLNPQAYERIIDVPLKLDSLPK